MISFWNLRRAAFLSQIAMLRSLLNQGVLRPFEGEVFGIVSFAIAIDISVKCFIRTVVFDGLVWFLCLMAYQLFVGYLMPKPFS